jgi:hypothetical protein
MVSITPICGIFGRPGKASGIVGGILLVAHRRYDCMYFEAKANQGLFNI